MGRTLEHPAAPLSLDAAPRFRRKLHAWFRARGRDLPWRRTRDPYHIVVSELMLQQTQVARVVDYYARFLDRFPTVHDVARARPARVREAWAGLGYYARARNLHALARQVTDRGRAPTASFPTTAAELRKLPGIGAYTAGAVASFAFERRAALVDTNVARVLARVFAPRLDPKSARDQRQLWAIAERILPRTGRATWTHNQALMELGALVCTARVARCGECPVRSVCASGMAVAPAGRATDRPLRGGTRKHGDTADRARSRSGDAPRARTTQPQLRNADDADCANDANRSMRSGRGGAPLRMR